jgi:aspartyl-tRNA(Asn)/glutamyl-tRNA(Gln) amidotransferase subunit A
MKLNNLTLKQTLDKLKTKNISLEELYKDIFLQIESYNNKLNIYLSIDKNSLNEAKKNKDRKLAGVPIAIKDNFLTIGLPTTASSKVLSNFLTPYESTVTSKIKNAGGVLIGKTNMDAWAHGSSTETSDFGSTKNPRNTEYLPGGSSGGSAAAVVSNMCISAIGSETAGSIRQPAAWCGCVGLKPTYGRVSRYGVVAMGSSLDSPGPITKTVEDAAIIYNIIAGNDKNDATTANIPLNDLTKILEKGVKGLKIGICYMDHPKIKDTILSQSIFNAAKVFEKLGAKIYEVKTSEQLTDDKILTPDYSIGLYTVLQRGEVSSNLARYDGIRYGNPRNFFGGEAKRRIMLGTFTLSKGYAEKYYTLSQKVRTIYLKNFEQLFSKYDLLISSPSPGFAQKIGASKDNPMFGELEDMLNEASSIAGLPGISVPCYKDKKTNLYIGLSIMAKHFREDLISQAAYAYEQNTNWNEWALKEKENE